MKKLFRSSVTVSGALVLVTVSLVVSPALAQVRPTHRPDVPSFDKRKAPAVKQQRAAEVARGKAHLNAQLPGVSVDFDPLLDTPKFIRASDGFLTGPNGQGRGVTAQTAKGIAAEDPLRAIKGFINEHRDLFGHGPEVLKGARIKRDYVDKHNGLHTVVWEQQLDGIPVFRSVLMGHITRQGELVSLSSFFVPDPAASADTGTPGRAAAEKAPAITAAQALGLAAANLGMSLPESEITPAGGSTAEGGYLEFKTPEIAYARLVWLPLNRSSLRLSWEVILTEHDTKEQFWLVVDAITGEVWTRTSLTEYLTDASYNIWSSDSPSPFSPCLPAPGTYQPPLTNRFMDVTAALDTTASPDGWIPDADNTTTGNNCDAFVDRDFDQQPDQPRPTGVPNRVFDFTQDLNQDPKNYMDASTVQLFWRGNWYHDRLYQLGFTEASGNFQQNNFGRGGLGNDNIILYVQSGADVGIANNSMFGVSPDGQHGRCYMFVFDGPNPERDGSLDSDVVCHELTHGTSWRLVGGGMALGNLQGDGMGEGWSDFYPLCLLANPGDDPNATYCTGGYVTYMFYGMTENYYFGIRHFPYSTDMNKNPFTFKDIDPAQISPHTGVPRSPIYPFDPREADEVHHQGEVWCTALWEVHANLVTKYGWAGNEMTLQLVTDGMKLTPASPNFLQARDAILLADRIDNGGANQLEIWQGFAKRGMGFSATSPNGSTTAGVVEAFDLPGLFVARVVVGAGNGNGVIDNNECDDLTIYLGNNIGYQVTGVSARLSCSTPGAIVVQPLAAYAPIPNGATNGNLAPFRISIASDFICGTPLDCTLVVKSDQAVVTNKFRISTGMPGTPLRFDNSTAAAIPDLGETNSTVVVSNITTAVSKVTVSLHITHSYDSDLVIQLISPDGVTNTLSANNGTFGNNYGNACSPDSQRTTFDDEADTPINSGTAPFVGSYQPQMPLSVFIGKSGTNVNGIWRLRVVDQYAADVGVLHCWSLFVSPAECKDGGGECPGADLAIGMVSQPEPVLVGDPLTYTIGVTNNGPSSARNTIMTHLLPPGVIFVSASTTLGSVSQAGGVVTASLGSMPYASRATITVIVRPASVGTLTSTASVNSDESDPDPSNNSVTVISHVNPITSDLAVGLSALPSPVVLGNTLTYTVSVTNNGPSTGSGIAVTNILPSSAAVLSATVSQGSITTSGGLWNVGTLTSGSRATATITVMPTAEGTLTATATVYGNQFDPIVGNNVAAISTVVGPAADLAVGLADNPDPAITLSNVTYLISVTNLGPSAASVVTVSGSLPLDVNLVSTNASQGVVSVAGRAVSWTLGTLNKNARATLTLVVQTTTNGTLAASATVAGAQPDPNTANNTAAATTVVAPPGTAIAAAGATLTAESFMPANGAIDFGETVSIVLRLRNSSNVSTLNLVGTLQTTPGVTPVAPNNPQTYGVLAPSGFPVGRSFSFTANGTNGQVISPTLELHDGATTYPPVSFNFTLPTTRTYANTNTILVPDPAAPNPPYAVQSGPGKPYPSPITVSNLSGVLGKVTVTLSNLSHTFPGDVNVLLVGPGASPTKALLMSHAGDQPTTNATLTLDDAAALALPDGGPLVTGSWRPAAYGTTPSFPNVAGPYATTLSAFNASNPNGTWSLYVYDDAGGDDGVILNGWSLTLSMVSPVNQLADLNLAAADAPDPVLAGHAVTYTFTVGNNGPGAATSVGFTNTLPGGVTLLSATVSQGLVLTNGNSVIANLGTVNTNATATVTVVGLANASALPPGTNTASITNSATIGSSETDPNPGNNVASAVTTVTLPIADAAVSLVAAPDPVVTGFYLTNAIVVTNKGPNAALAAVVTAPLPPGAGFVSAVSSRGECTNTGAAVVCTLGDLPSGDSETISIVLMPTLPGLMTNSATVATSSEDPSLANNIASSVVNVHAPSPSIIPAGAVLMSESLANNGLIDPGETVTLALSLANIGSLDTVNLRAAVAPSATVLSPSAPQNYGVLLYGGPSASRTFTFTAATNYGNTLVVTLQLQDERGTTTNSLDPVEFTFSQPTSSGWSNSASILIPDHGMATPYPATITVTGLVGVVTKATATLNGFTHTFPHDVSALLVSPGASANVLLMSHTGGGRSVTNLTLTFDDAVTNALPESDSLLNGTFHPGSYPGAVVLPAPAPSGTYGAALDALAGRDPNGDWSLYVYDDTTGDSGYITGGWSLNLWTAANLRPLADLAVGLSSTPASLLAGGAITNTIWVTNLGPESATGVLLTNTLSSGQVLTTNIGSLDVGAAVRTVWVVVPAGGGYITNTASIGGNEADLNEGNNSATTYLTVSSAFPAVLTGAFVNGEFRLNITCQPNFVYAIEVSTNLTSWVPVSTNTASAGGVIKYTDTASPGFTDRFYRTRCLTP